jgi:hypothetical protein
MLLRLRCHGYFDIAEADVYNASVPKLYGIIFEAPLLQKLLCEDISLVDSITLRHSDHVCGALAAIT